MYVKDATPELQVHCWTSQSKSVVFTNCSRYLALRRKMSCKWFCARRMHNGVCRKMLVSCKSCALCRQASHMFFLRQDSAYVEVFASSRRRPSLLDGGCFFGLSAKSRLQHAGRVSTPVHRCRTPGACATMRAATLDSECDGGVNKVDRPSCDPSFLGAATRVTLHFQTALLHVTLHLATALLHVTLHFSTELLAVTLHFYVWPYRFTCDPTRVTLHFMSSKWRNWEEKV